MISQRQRVLTRYQAARVLFALLFVLLALTGGSSRYDVGTLFVLRPLLVLVAAIGLALVPAGELGPGTRVPGILLGLLAAVIAVQLVPMPPAMWTALPAHAGDSAVAGWLGMAQPWRPLSMVPVLTWNSLLALLPAGAALVVTSRLNRGDLPFAATVLIGCGIASALLGVVQIGMGGAYLYSPNSPGLPTGLFANRNHQAAFLAGLLPLLAVWTSVPGQRVTLGARRFGAGMVAMLFVITVLITGSRTGLLLVLLNLAGAGWIIWRTPSRRGSRLLIPFAALAAALVLLIGGAVYLGRGGGIDRFAAFDAGAEMRVQAFPVLRELVTRYLPWGSGFGTFDPLFRIHEPDRLLNPTYFNHAHNDLMELALTGGAPALLLLAALVGWMGWRIVTGRVWCSRSTYGTDSLAAAMMGMTWLLASLPDYPLRTPLAGASLALACCMLSVARPGPRGGGL